MEWKNFLYFHRFSILAYFNVVFIPSAVNKAAFDQMHKRIEEKSSSQRSTDSTQINKVREKNPSYNQISDISNWGLNSLQL